MTEKDSNVPRKDSKLVCQSDWHDVIHSTGSTCPGCGKSWVRGGPKPARSSVTPISQDTYWTRQVESYRAPLSPSDPPRGRSDG